MMLGMGIAIAVPYLVLFAINDVGMTSSQYVLLLALAAMSQATMNTIAARVSDTRSSNRKRIIITALFMRAVSFSIYFYMHELWVFRVMYAIFRGCFPRAMPQMYASA